MTWSADDEYRTRVLARRGSVLRLRHPGAAFGFVAGVLLFAAGLTAAFWGATGFAGAESTRAVALALPAAVATAIAMLAIGGRLHRHEETCVGSIVVRVALIWALFGAVWVLGAAGPGIAAGAGQGFAPIAAALIEAGRDGVGGALVGAFGGAFGAVAATLLCIERRV